MAHPRLRPLRAAGSESGELVRRAICRTCLDRALRLRGSCPGCRTDRVLPGRDPAGTPICRDCAGIARSFFCDRCGHEGILLGGRLCERCTLGDRLDELLDDDTGRTAPALLPLRELLLASGQPRSRLLWLRSPPVRELLTDLATGRTPVTHDGLQQHRSWRAVVGIRDLLTACGVLPPADRRLLLYQRWLIQHLETVGAHSALLGRFVSWHQMRRLRDKAATGPLQPSSTNHARQQILQAGAFLAWLDTRGVGLGSCSQADLDAWHAEKHATRCAAQSFLRWCMTSGHMPTLTIRTRSTVNPAPITQHRRIAMIGRCLTDDQMQLPVRIAGCLLLLYAQPVSRIVQLTIDDVITANSGVALRLGHPPSPVPAPLDGLLLQHLSDLHAEAFSGRWLFPGRRAAQPLHPTTLRDLLRAAGIPPEAGRTGTLRQLVLQTPPPVVAEALGYHHISTTRIAAQAGSPWSQYAPGDHTN